jgi:hypothetical protein
MILNYQGDQEFLKSLCPNTYQDNYNIKNVFEMAKEMLKWQSKGSKAF